MLGTNHTTTAPQAETKSGPSGFDHEPVVHQSLTRQRWSGYFLAIGIVTTIIGLVTAFGGIGLIFLLFAPLWFGLAAILRPTRRRIIAACFVMGCWIFAAVNVLT